VDDDVHLRTALRHAFRTEGHEVREAATLREALDALEDQVPDLVICDVRLPDGSGVDVVRAATALSPLPLVVAISGKASPSEAFQVAEAGARAYLEKPISFRKLREEVERVRSSAPPLDPVLRAQVGHVDLKALGDDVRTELVNEAMALADGNVTQAAKLLKVTRQAVQHNKRRKLTPPDAE
jgi:DNA-binding NtrC family response regulator